MKRKASMALVLGGIMLLLVGAVGCERSVPEPPTPTVYPTVESTEPPPPPATSAGDVATVISVLPDTSGSGTPTPTIRWDLPTFTPTPEPTAVDTATPAPPTSTPVPAAGSATATPEQTTPEQDLITYVVQSGDTLYGIAAYYEVSVAEIMQTNNLVNEFIRVGDELTIPKAQSGADPVTPSQTYTVVAGDTLYGIAARFGTTADAIAQANGIYNPAFIKVGDVLTIPGGGTQVIGAPRVHVVQAGDTLTGIATRYGTTSAAISLANNLTNPNFLRVGQRLTIPAN